VHGVRRLRGKECANNAANATAYARAGYVTTRDERIYAENEYDYDEN
jgi:hypothetical protein